MKLHKSNEKDTFSKGKAIADQIWNLLWEVRFLSKETTPSNDRLKTLLQSKEELMMEVKKTKSNNLLEVRKNWPEKEIAYRLEDILTTKNNQERDKLTKLTNNRNQLKEEEKKIALQIIKKILDDFSFFSKHIKNEDISRKVEIIIKNYLEKIKNLFNEIIIIDEKFLINKQEKINERIDSIETFKNNIYLLYPMITEEEKNTTENILKRYEKHLTIFKKD